MARKLIAGILSLSFLFLVPQLSVAQDVPPKEKSNQVKAKGPRRHLQTIVFSGLAGAILGLSTLSFYGRPQDKLGNIAVGFAVGIFSGTIYTTYKAATEPKEFYSERNATSEFLLAMEQTRSSLNPQQIPQAAWTFQF